MKPTEQTVYLPVKAEEHENYKIFDLHEYEGDYIETVTEGYGYFFTPEQLNQLLSDVIKDALDTAAYNAEIDSVNLGASEFQDVVSKSSITNTFDITFQKHKV